MLIKIVRESIIKNPTAGKTRTAVFGPRDITFSIAGKLPNFLKEHEDVIITKIYGSVEDPSRTEGYLLNESKQKLFSSLKTPWTIDVDNNVQFIDHMPEPNYLYQYEDPELKCLDCGKSCKVSEIETNSDSEYNLEQCPNCKAIESFEEYRYENINDVLKEKAPK